MEQVLPARTKVIRRTLNPQSSASSDGPSRRRRTPGWRGTHPHGLRHQGSRRRLDLAGGDVRKVQRFSRHGKLETLLRYDDNRREEAGAIAHLLGEDSV